MEDLFAVPRSPEDHGTENHDLANSAFSAGGESSLDYTIAPAWIDAAGRTRTWALRDPAGAKLAEITTRRDAEKLANLLTQVMEGRGEDDSSPVAALYKKDSTPAPEGGRARELLDNAIERLIDQLDCGRSEAMTRYLTTMGRFHKYSWGNVLLIYTQFPDATQVAGFSTWKQLGRYVKKGERGIAILAPSGRGRAIEESAPEEDQVEGGGEGAPASTSHGPARHFHVVHVFDISQTEGEDLSQPPAVTGRVGDRLANLERFARDEMGIQVNYAESLDGAYGVSMGGRILVLKHLPEAQRFSVLCHELAHEMLHWTATPDVRKDKTLIETQAEAVAFTVCHSIGLENAAVAAADYIGLYRGNRETLRQSLAAIHQAAGRILEVVG